MIAGPIGTLLAVLAAPEPMASSSEEISSIKSSRSSCCEAVNCRDCDEDGGGCFELVDRPCIGGFFRGEEVVGFWTVNFDFHLEATGSGAGF